MLRSSNNKFDQFVKGTFENASADPPPNLWNRIEKQLPPNTSWYSKYKYLLLLLLLSFTSSSSILVYKHLVLKNSARDIALNKRYIRDERSRPPVSNAPVPVLTEGKNENKNDSSPANNSSGKQDLPSVTSFYAADNTIENSVKTEVENAAASKAERIKKFEVKVEKDEGNTPKNVNASSFLPVTSQKIKSKKSEVVAKLNAAELASLASANTTKTNAGYSGTITANSTMTTESDVTTPITEPIRVTDAEPLLASATPVKFKTTPLSGKEILRSMVDPEKLYKLDIESQAAGINQLNPAKEKMLRNLKQFAGYDINKGFHIGAFIGINNNWLNGKQFSADENTQSIKPKVQFGKSYGVNIGYDYSDRWGIELEWQISEQGQKYTVVQADGNHTKNIDLRYTKFPLMLKYKHMFLNNYNSKPIAVSFLFGPQMSFLLKQNIKQDGKGVKIEPQYNKVEMGLMGGFDFDLFMTRYMYLTIGARAGFGSNFHKSQPMSFQLGVTTQINFRFPKKLK